PEAEEALREACLLRPDSGPAHLALAQATYGQHKYGEAVDAFREAFRLDPAGAAGARQRAGCSPARARCGRGAGAAHPSPRPRRVRRWRRRRALRGLAGARAAWRTRLEQGGPADRAALVLAVGAWRTEPQLACVRDADGLADLPEGERPVWRQLWHDVAELIL